MRSALLSLALFLSPLPALAMDVIEVESSRVEQVFKIVESNGCKVTEADLFSALSDSDMTDLEEVSGIFGQLLFDGRMGVVLDTGEGEQTTTYEVYDGSCPYGPSPDFTMMVQEMVAYEGCQLDLANADEALDGWNLSLQAVGDTLPLMEAAGMLEMMNHDTLVHIPLKTCIEIGVPIGDSYVANWDVGPDDGGLRDDILNEFTAAGCALTYGDAQKRFEARGTDWKSVLFVLAELSLVGEVIIVAPNENIILRTGACA